VFGDSHPDEVVCGVLRIRQPAEKRHERMKTKERRQCSGAGCAIETGWCVVVAIGARALGDLRLINRNWNLKLRSVVMCLVGDSLCAGKVPGDLVFPGRDGGYLPRPKSSGGWFAGAIKRAKAQSITPHDLRHTCAPLAVSAGVNVLALQGMLGHTSAKVTLHTYADLFDDDLDTVAVTLHARYSPENVGKVWATRGHEPAQQTPK
jgi:hypothetical protein